MEPSKLTEIHACAELVGFWQFAIQERRYFGVLERASEEKGSALKIGSLVDGGPSVLKTILNEDKSINAIDAAPIGRELVFGLEINRGSALQLVSAELAALVDPAVRQVSFKPMRDVGLSESQQVTVHLPPTKQWNVADPLAPAQWLFSPRLTRGSPDGVELIANTADGQALIFDSRAGARGYALPNAAEPQAWSRNGHRYVMFERMGERYFPFWFLPRYSGDALPRSGELMVAKDQDASENLSADLRVGPVMSFALADDGGEAPWAFALRSASSSSTEVIALKRGEPAWVVVARWPLEGHVQRMSAEYGGERWHLLYARKSPNGWSLRYQSWRAGG